MTESSRSSNAAVAKVKMKVSAEYDECLQDLFDELGINNAKERFVVCQVLGFLDFARHKQLYVDDRTRKLYDRSTKAMRRRIEKVQKAFSDSIHAEIRRRNKRNDT